MSGKILAEIVGIPNMEEYHRQIMREIDVWLEEQDIQRDDRLNKQRDEALKIIDAAEVDLENKGLYTFAVEEKFRPFKRGVIVWKFLSPNFFTTLREIYDHAGFWATT